MSLKELRKKRNLTQEKLAERTGLALVTIKKLEKSEFNPSIKTISKLATALNYSGETILSAILNDSTTNRKNKGS